jgi:hypothetical protein
MARMPSVTNQNKHPWFADTATFQACVSQRDRAGRRKTVAWKPDDEIVQGFVRIGWAAGEGKWMTGQEGV